MRAFVPGDESSNAVVVVPTAPVRFFVMEAGVGFDLVFCVVSLDPDQNAGGRPKEVRCARVLRHLGFRFWLFEDDVSQFVRRVVSGRAKVATVPLCRASSLFVRGDVRGQLSCIRAGATELFGVRRSRLVDVVRCIDVASGAVGVRRVRSWLLDCTGLPFDRFFQQGGAVS